MLWRKTTHLCCLERISGKIIPFLNNCQEWKSRASYLCTSITSRLSVMKQLETGQSLKTSWPTPKNQSLLLSNHHGVQYKIFIVLLLCMTSSLSVLWLIVSWSGLLPKSFKVHSDIITIIIIKRHLFGFWSLHVMLVSLAKVTVKQFDVFANNGSVGQVCKDLQPFTLQLLSVKKFTTSILIQKKSLENKCDSQATEVWMALAWLKQ